MKMCIANLVSKFRFLPYEKATKHVEWDVAQPFGEAKGGLWIKCEPR